MWMNIEACGRTWKAVASWGLGWDHVSISEQHRILVAKEHMHPPPWEVMQRMRELFFLPEETVLQIHPPADQYVNYHPGVLHLWRSHNQVIEPPPTWMIGPK